MNQRVILAHRVASLLTRRALATKAAAPFTSSSILASGSRQRIPFHHNTRRNIRPPAFSTDASTPSSETDLSSMSSAELQQLAMKSARQGNPVQADAVFDHLLEHHSCGEEEELSIVRTSIIDSWLQYQSSQRMRLQESVAQQDLLPVQMGRLQQICDAAESASKLVQGMADPSSHHILAALQAWATVCEAAHEAGLVKVDGVRGIPQRTQHLLVTMEGTTPSVEMVNQVLKAWACSGEHLRGTMAEQLFQQYFPITKTATVAGNTTPSPTTLSPDGDSFRHMIRAWSWSKERRCAFTATGHFMRMMRLLEIGRTEMEPTLEDYRILFGAWTTAEDKNAPSKVQTVLQIADDAYRNGLTDAQPDINCYRDVLITMSRRVNVPEVGELADKTLQDMKKDRMMIPTTECYGAAILAWTNVATARECDDREMAVQRAWDLLQEMIKAFHRTTTVIVRPTTKHYNYVLRALTISRRQGATNQAEALLKHLEDSNSESDDLIPNAETYTHVLNVWRSSKRPNKTEEGTQTLQRMRDRMDQIRQNSDEGAIVGAYSAFISVCAFTSTNDVAYRTRLLTSALRTLDEVRDLGLTPDSTIYASLLEACDKLVLDGKDRQRILENIFQRACEEGHVDQAVLEHFKAAASTYLYAKLVVAPSREIEHMKVVPESWTRNVKGFTASGKGGRKVLPLTIEGKFTFTKAAAEYKMRKLRRQENKQMLQGGRMK